MCLESINKLMVKRWEKKTYIPTDIEEGDGTFRYNSVSCGAVEKSFHIEPPLPSAVVTGQGVPFNWIRDPSTDPSEFSFRKNQLTGPDSGISQPFQVDKDEASRASGSFTLTFTSLSPYVIEAVHKSLVSFFIPPVTIVPPEALTAGTNSNSTTTFDRFSSIRPSATSNDANPNTSTGNPTPASAPETNGPPTSTAPSRTVAGISASSKNTKPKIIGSVVGGTGFILLLLLLLFFIRRCRNKPSHTGLTPFLDTTPSSGSDAPYMDIGERKVQMLGQRERLERELEAYEQAESQESNSGTENVPDGINEPHREHGVAQVSRRQIEALTERIAALEAAMAPPDYSSGRS